MGTARSKFDFKNQIFLLFFWIFKLFYLKSWNFLSNFQRAVCLTASTQLFRSSWTLKRDETQLPQILSAIAAVFPLQSAAPWPLHKRSFFASIKIWQWRAQGRIQCTRIHEHMFVYNFIIWKFEIFSQFWIFWKFKMNTSSKTNYRNSWSGQYILYMGEISDNDYYIV